MELKVLKEFDFAAHSKPGFALKESRVSDLYFLENGQVVIGIRPDLKNRKHAGRLPLKYPLQMQEISLDKEHTRTTFGPLQGVGISAIYLSFHGITYSSPVPEPLKQAYLRRAAIFHGLTEEGFVAYKEYLAEEQKFYAEAQASELELQLRGEDVPPETAETTEESDDNTKS